MRSLVIAIAVWASFFTSAAGQEIMCVSDDEEINSAMAKHNEKLQFVGVNKMGRIFFVYAGKATWTVWFVMPEGAICTGPQYLGDILQIEDPSKAALMSLPSLQF